MFLMRVLFLLVKKYCRKVVILDPNTMLCQSKLLKFWGIAVLCLPVKQLKLCACFCSFGSSAGEAFAHLAACVDFSGLKTLLPKFDRIFNSGCERVFLPQFLCDLDDQYITIHVYEGYVGKLEACQLPTKYPRLGRVSKNPSMMFLPFLRLRQNEVYQARSDLRFPSSRVFRASKSEGTRIFQAC